jgi:hypothetical protein
MYEYLEFEMDLRFPIIIKLLTMINEKWNVGLLVKDEFERMK